MDSRRTQLIAIGAFAAVIVVVAIVIGLGGSDGEGGSDGDLSASSAQVESLFEGIPQDGVRLGEPDAEATVIEFVDLQCPFCAEFAVNAMPRVVEERVRSGELALELQILTFLGEDSVEAGQLAAAAAQQDRLWHFADLFFLNQGAENTGYVTEEFLTDLAEATPGLDAEEALSQRDSDEADELLTGADALARELGAMSTPSFWLERDGEEPVELRTRLDAASFLDAVDSELAGR